MWEIVGFESRKDEAGKVLSYTIHCVKPFSAGQGSGQRVRTAWYNADRVPYVPVVGERVFIEEEKRGNYLMVTDIYPV